MSSYVLQGVLIMKIKVLKAEFIEFFCSILPLQLLASLNFFKKRNVTLSENKLRWVNQLKTDGFVQIDLEELGIKPDIMNNLEEAINKKGAKKGSHKPYQKYYLGGDFQEIETIEDPGLRDILRLVALNDQMLDFVSASFENTQPSLRYIEAIETNHNDLDIKADEIYSQKWHRDNGGFKVIKLFICMSDISNKDGPLQYVVCSHRSSRTKLDLPAKGFGARTTPAIPEHLVNNIDCSIKSVVGKKWSAFACDTSGVHRGGNYDIESNRRMLTLAYFHGLSTAPTKTML